jgi:hypothetical protein
MACTVCVEPIGLVLKEIEVAKGVDFVVGVVPFVV